jgi:hypothetical protein
MLVRVWPTAALREPVRWHYDATVTSGTIASGQVGASASGFAGNTNVSPVLRFDEFEVITPQRVTVARSVNGVEKAHEAGTAVSLAVPAPLAL